MKKQNLFFLLQSSSCCSYWSPVKPAAHSQSWLVKRDLWPLLTSVFLLHSWVFLQHPNEAGPMDSHQLTVSTCSYFGAVMLDVIITGFISVDSVVVVVVVVVLQVFSYCRGFVFDLLMTFFVLWSHTDLLHLTGWICTEMIEMLSSSEPLRSHTVYHSQHKSSVSPVKTMLSWNDPQYLHIFLVSGSVCGVRVLQRVRPAALLVFFALPAAGPLWLPRLPCFLDSLEFSPWIPQSCTKRWLFLSSRRVGGLNECHYILRKLIGCFLFFCFPLSEITRPDWSLGADAGSLYLFVTVRDDHI